MKSAWLNMWRSAAMTSLVFMLLFSSCCKEDLDPLCDGTDQTGQQRSMDESGTGLPTDQGGISDDGNDDGDKERSRKTRGN